MSLEYELVPGVESTEGVDGIGPLLVGIEYEADVPFPWEPTDGGAIARLIRGAPTTHPTRGAWPLPRDAVSLRFTLYRVDEGSRWPTKRPTAS